VNRHSPKKRGFTMLEILVVIAVLGILMSIGSLFLGPMIRQQRLNEATRTLGETLRRVSDLALNQSQEYTLSNNSTTLTWLGESGATGNQTLPYNLTIASVMPSGNITFSGRGLPKNTGVLFTIGSGSNTRKVYLFPTGAISYP
jgi:prepilin-type N-terminal cleavage/methylation domain-containing protein